MRGKVSEAQRSLVKKLYENYKMSPEDIAEQLGRSVNSVNAILGLETAPEQKTRTAFTPGYEQLTVDLDRGQVKFYLPKDLTEEDVEMVLDTIVLHYGLETTDSIPMEEIEIVNPKDKFAVMRQIIEETALEAEAEEALV